MPITAIIIDNTQWYQLLRDWQNADEFPDRLFAWLQVNHNIVKYEHCLDLDPGYYRVWFNDSYSALMFGLKH